MSLFQIYIVGYIIIVSIFTTTAVVLDEAVDQVIPIVFFAFLWPIWAALGSAGLVVVVAVGVVTAPGFALGHLIRHLRSRN